MDRDFKSKKRKEIEAQKEFDKLRKENNFEKGDILALIIAAFTTIFPFAIGIFILLFLIPKLLLRI